MQTRGFFQVAIALAFLAVRPAVAAAADKETIQLQTQVQGVQDQLSRLQRSLDENIGILSEQMNHNSEKIRKLQGSVEAMRRQLEERNRLANTRVDDMSSQVKTLQDAISQLRAHLEIVMSPPPQTPVPTKSGSTPAETSAQQPVVPPAQPTPVSPEKPLAGPPEQPVATVQSHKPLPPPEQAPGNTPTPVSGADLYEAAMQHYASKDFEAAENEFTRFLKSDRKSEKAVTAQFYLAEIEYEQQDFEGALDDYTEVAPRLSNPSQAATAQYKKALCLLEVERQDEAVRELQAVMERYPRSPEAARAAKKLRTLQPKQGSATRR